MERATAHHVPLTDTPESSVEVSDSHATGSTPPVAAPHRSHQDSEPSDRPEADAACADRIHKPLSASRIRHISFEMAIATGLIPFLPTDLLRAAHDLALGRRR